MKKQLLCGLLQKIKINNLLPSVYCLGILLSIPGFMQEISAQNCSVNANVDQTICANTTLTLVGSTSGLYQGGPAVTTWSQVSGPSAVITSPNSLITTVTSILGGKTYRFRLSTNCLDGSLVFDDVTYTVSVTPTANAGADFAIACPGTSMLAGNALQADESGLWTVVSGSGLTITTPASATSSFTLSNAASGNSVLRWTITNTSTGCVSYDDVTIPNMGGVTPVNAGPDQVLASACYNTTTSALLAGSYAGEGSGGQGGLWSVVSGPNTPLITAPTSNTSGITNLIQGTYLLRWRVTGPCANGVDEVQITVPAPIGASTVASASIQGNPPMPFCDARTSVVLLGNSTLLANETGKWTQTSGPAGAVIGSPNNPTTTITNLDGSGSYNFAYTILNALTGCNTISNVGISYGTAAPSVTITTPGPYIMPCSSSTATITYTQTGTGTPQYNILSGPTTPAIPTIPSGYANAGSPLVINGFTVPGTYLIRLRKFAGTGSYCETDFKDITVIVSQTPTASNAGSAQLLACSVTSTELAGNPTLVGSGSWSQVSGPSIATIANPQLSNTMISGLINGSYAFRWIISGGPTCPTKQADATVRVALIPPTAANAGPDQLLMCFGTPIAMAANAPVLNETGTWTVSPAAGVTFSNVNSRTAVVDGLVASTSYTFTWTITNGCGSSADACLVTTTSTQGPVKSLAGSDQCQPAGTTAITLAGNNPAPGTGVWTKLSGPAATFTNANLYNTGVTAMTNGNYQFIWTISYGGCAVSFDTTMVTISPPATPANAGVDQTACGSTVSLSGNIPAVGTGRWSQVSGTEAVITSPTSNNTTVTGLTEGVYVFRWTISNNACPGNVDDVQISVSTPSTVANAGPDQVICGVTTATMAANTIVVGTGYWSIVSGQNTPVITSISSPVTTITGLTTGMYTFRWNSSNGPFCPLSTDDITVTIDPVADAGADQALCAASAANLSGNASTTGTWTQVGVTPNIATITPTTANTATASGLTAGSYTFRYSISSPGCTPSSDDMLVVISAMPSPAASAGADQNLCNVTGWTMSANSPAPGVSGWVKIEGTDNPAFTPATAANAAVTGATAQTYVYEWRVTNGSCVTADQVKISLSSISSANAGPDQNTVCGTVATMAATAPTNGVGTWSQISGPNSATISSQITNNTTMTGLIAGTYVFRWTLTSGVCASVSDDVSVTVFTSPTIADAGSDQILCNAVSAALAGNVITVGSGAWSQISGPNTATITSPGANNSTLTGLIGGTYVFRWTSTNAICSTSDQVTINNSVAPTASSATPALNNCLFTPLNLAGNTPVVGSGVWTQTAGAPVIIVAPSSPTTAILGAVAGSYTFRWTISNGTCPASGSNEVVTISDIPTMALAGPDQSLCNTSTATLAGNTPEAGKGTGTWSQVNGPAATINNPALPASTVTLTIAGTYTFKWEIATGASCKSSDQMQIIRNSDVSATGPSDATICNGGTALMSVTASGGTPPYTYQWEQSANGTTGWVNASGGSGATASSYTTASLAADLWFRSKVTCACGTTTSPAGHVTIVPDPNITVHPVAATTICSGTTTTLSVTATGGTPSLTYQWQSNTTGCGGAWADIPLATGNSYTTLALAQTTYYQVLVKASGNGCTTATSNCATVYVPRITTQPVASNASICVGGNSVLSVATETGVPAIGYTYQWQYNSGSWNNVVNGTPAGTTYTSATTASMTVSGVTVVATHGYRVLIQVTSPACTALASSTANLTVVPDPSVTVQPTNPADICVGGTTANMTITATGGTPSLNYQWQYFNGATWNNVANGTPAGSSYTGSTLASFSVAGISVAGSYPYHCLVSATGSDCNTATSNSATVTVVPDPAITVQPTVTTTICSGTTTTLSVTATGGTPLLTYQWQSNATGCAGVWADIPGATAISYTTAALTQTTYYRVLVNASGNGCNTVTSGCATVYVPRITTQPAASNAAICVGGSSLLTVAAETGVPPIGYTYQWQYDSDPTAGVIWNNVVNGTPAGSVYTNATTAAMMVAGITLTGTHDYRVLIQVTSPACATLTSSTSTITVVPDPAITSEPVSPAAICTGGNSANMTLTATGGTPSLNYQWQYFNGATWNNVANGTPAGSVYTGSALATFSVAGISVAGNYPYRCNVSATGNDCNTATSATITVSVVADPTLSLPVFSNTSICAGGSTTVSSTISGGTATPTYQWQYNNGSWNNVVNGTPAGTTYTNATTPAMTISGATGAGAYQYRLTTNNTSGCDFNSAGASCTVVADPGITTQPSSPADICVGGTTANISVVAAGGTPSLIYQWEYYNGSTWSSATNGTPAGSVYTGASGSAFSVTGISIAGSYQYRCFISASGSGCGTVTSNTVIVTVVADPTINTQPGGTAICSGSTAILSVSASGGTPSLAYQWQSAVAPAGPYANVSGGSGANTATYTTAALAATTYYQVVITASGNGCNPVTSAIATVTVNNPATANAGGNNSVCSNGSFTLSAATAASYTSLLWTTSGTGTFDNAAALHPAYTPGASDISAGTVNLTLTAYSAVPCPNAGSSMTLTIFQAPSSNAGPAQNLCNATGTALAGNVPAAGTGTWTRISGPNVPVITGVNLANTTITGMIAGTYVFQWSISNGSCAAATSTVSVVNSALPSASNAGPDQSFCGLASATMAANNPASGTGAWTQVSGPNTATIANAANPLTQVTGLIKGAYVFSWTISNGTCANSADNVSVTVTNCSPVAVNDAITTNEDTPVTIAVNSNDTDADGIIDVSKVDLDPATAGIQVTFTVAGQGTYTVNASGIVTFTPVLNFNGPATPVNYTVQDNSGAISNIATITVTVTAMNDPPVAVNDVATTNEDTPVTINVTANDTDVEGPVDVTKVDLDPATAGIQTSFTVAGQGTYTVDASGIVTFTPVLNFNGPATPVNYTVQDNSGTTSNIATITITVTAVNDPPVAMNDAATTNEDTPVTINVTANDTDVEGPVDVTKVDLDPATAGIQTSFTVAGQGTYTVNASGIVTFTPVLNFNGPATPVNYTVQDNSGTTSNIATITITVTAVNDPPVAVNDALTTNEDTPVTIAVTTNDTDVDGSVNTATVDLDPATAGIQATFIVAGQGTYTVNAVGIVTFNPVLNFNGPATPVNYTVQDNSGTTSNIATITITVTAVNDPPVAVNDPATTNEDTPLTINVTGNDTDVDGTINAATVDLDPATAGIQATFTVAGQGTYTVNASGIVTFTPVLNFNGPATPVNYTVQDNSGAISNIATITVTVTAVNDPPVAVNDAATTTEDTPVTINVTGNDTDVDGSIALNTVDLDPATAGIQATFTVAGQGTYAVNASGIVTFTPDLYFNGIATPVNYTVQDNNGATSNIATITITISSVNNPPVAVNDPATTDEDTPVTINVTVNDSDIDGSINVSTVDLDPATAGIQTTFTVTGQGTYSVNASGIVTFTPVLNFNGTATPVNYTVQDNNGATSNIATINVTVTAVNDPPVAVNDAATTSEDTPVTINVTGNDTDADGTIDAANVDLDPATPGIQASFTVAGQGTYTVNALGIVTFTPVLNFNGTATPVNYTVQDNSGATSNIATITITVNAVNDPPVAANDAATTNEDTPGTVNVTANDTDTDGTINVSTVDLDPATAGIQATFTVAGQGTYTVNASGIVTFTPALNFNGTATPLSYTIQDNNGATSNIATITFTVTAVNDIPTAVNDIISTPEDTPVTGAATAGNDLPSGDGGNIWSLSGINGGAAHGTVTMNPDGTYTYTPVANFFGTDTFNYQLCDADGDCSSASVTITVYPVDDAPVAVNDAAATPEDTPLSATAATNDIPSGDGGNIWSLSGANGGAVHGTVTMNPDGSYIYTPNANYSGTDVFTYQVCDVDGDCSVARITVSVAGVNDLPVAVNDAASTPKNVRLKGSAAGNDTPSGDGGNVWTLTGADGGALHGTVTMDPDGNYNYTPALDYNGTDIFTYKVCDMDGDCSSATVTVTINPAGNAPVAVNDVNATNEDTPVSGNVSVNDTPSIDGGNRWGLVGSNGGAANGSVTMNPDGTYTYIPNASFNGTDIFTYQLCDVDGDCSVAMVTLSVSSLDDVPVAVDDAANTPEDTSLNGSVAGNDTPSGDGGNVWALVGINGGAANGKVTMNPDGSYTYIPDANYNGTDKFTYQVCDADGDCAVATVIITIDPVNDLPVAVNDAASTPGGIVLSGSAAGNDTPSGDGGNIWALIGANGGAANGTVSMGTNGNYTYIPDPDYSGTDVFNYRVCDADGDCSSATVTITITRIALAPVAVNDVNTTNEDTPVTGNVSTNDTPSGDGGNAWSLAGTNGGAANGTVTMNPDGSYIYTPNANYNGTDVFTYQVCDVDGDCSVATVTVTISGVNDLPVAVNDAASTPKDIILNGSAAGNDTPSGDGGNIWTLIGTDGGAAHGTVTMGPNGNYTYTPALNYNGTDIFTYKVCDVDGDCSTATVTVTVNSSGNAPVAMNDANTTNEDIPVSGNVSTNDTPSIDGGNTWMLVGTNGGAANGTVTMNPDGSYTYTPQANFNGTDVFSYQVCDAEGDCSVAMVTITVTGMNDLPVAVNDAAGTPEDTELHGSVAGNDTPSGDGGNVWTLSGVNGGAMNGTVTMSANGNYIYIPGPSFSGTDSFTYQLCDANGDCSSATVTITIAPADDAPVAVNDVNTTNEDTPVSGIAAANDTGSGDGSNVWSLTGADGGAAHGTVSMNPDGSYTYTPAPNYCGTDTFSYQVCDVDGDCSVATVTITIISMNDLPVAVNDAAGTPEETRLNGSVAGNDKPSGDGGNVWSLAGPDGGAAHGVVTMNPDGAYFYFPNVNFYGTDIFTYQVCDIDGDCATATVTIAITNVNDVPVAANDAVTTTEDTPVNGNASANDTPSGDGGNIWSLIGANGGATNGTVTMNPDGTYTYTPNANYSGTDVFSYELCDGSAPADCSMATITVTITGINDLPIAVNDINTTTEDTPVNGNASANDTPSGDGGNIWSLIGANGGATNGTVTMNPDGTYTYTPNANFFGTDIFTYELCDGSAPADCSTATVSITITGVNDLPLAVNDVNTTAEDTPVNGNVSTNDTPSGDDGNVWSLSGPNGGAAHGTITMNPDGTYSYIPVKGFFGADIFTYQLCDADGDCTTATVTVTVNGVYHNQPPVAFDDHDTTQYETVITVNILGNDHDPENGKLTVTLCADPLHGTAVISSDGTLSYTPFNGFSGNDSLCYTICDPGSPALCDEGMLYIHVIPSTDADNMVISHTLTPNGDGINDSWQIGGIENFPENEVDIYNRWGDRVYEGAHYNNKDISWDGTWKHNEILPNGTYFYILEITGVKTFTGWIYITNAR